MNVSAYLGFVLLVMFAIAYVSGGEVASTYNSHMIYKGHEIFVANETSASIDGNPAEVIHIGDVRVSTFKIYSIPENDTIILTHSISGYVGEQKFIGLKSVETTFRPNENITMDALNLENEGSINNVIVYRYGNILIGATKGTHTVFTAGDGTYMITVKDTASGVVVSMVKYLVQEYAIESIILVIFMGIIIFIIGFAAVSRR